VSESSLIALFNWIGTSTQQAMCGMRAFLQIDVPPSLALRGAAQLANDYGQDFMQNLEGYRKNWKESLQIDVAHRQEQFFSLEVH
jgi:hypothetical protein